MKGTTVEGTTLASLQAQKAKPDLLHMHTPASNRLRPASAPADFRGAAGNLAIQRKALVSGLPHGGGIRLDQATLSVMETRFGESFEDVRIHNDGASADAASQVRAQAFTVGRDIYFGKGRYQPDSTTGQKLLAHELTHTLQQPHSVIAQAPDALQVSSPGDASEREAEGIAERVLSGSSSQAPSVLPVSPHVQRDWLDDAKAAVSGTYDAATSAVGGAYNTVASTVGDAYSAVTTTVSEGVNAVAEGVHAVVSGVSSAGEVVASVASGVAGTVSTHPEQTRTNLIARLNATRQQVQDADPAAVTADTSQIGALNQQISTLNAALPETAAAVPAIPLIELIADAIVTAIEAIIAFLLGATVATILIIAIIILAIIALIVYLVKTAKEKDKAKEKEDEDEKEKRKRTPLRWNPTTVVNNAVASGGIVGALELGIGVPSPPTGLQFDAHHVWPKFAGGPEQQPLMGIFSFIHLSIMHPLMLNPLLTTAFGITNRRTDPTNIAFIARLRSDAAFRAQVASVLTAFYLSLNSQTDPPIPPSAYLPGISSSAVDIPLLP